MLNVGFENRPRLPASQVSTGTPRHESRRELEALPNTGSRRWRSSPSVTEATDFSSLGTSRLSGQKWRGDFDEGEALLAEELGAGVDDSGVIGAPTTPLDLVEGSFHPKGRPIRSM